MESEGILSNSEIEKKIKEKVEIWETKPAKEAEDYYYQEIFPLVVKKFHLETDVSFKEKYENLILSLGFSFEPLVLTISFIKPKQVLFLYTKDSRENLDKVIQWAGLLPFQYVAEEIEKDNPVDIYRVLKKIYVEKWNKPDKTAIDFTGGTKAMSAGMAMAGAYLKIDLIYVASEYNNKMRKPWPGTEKLKVVEDPYEVFGDLEKDKAIALFNKGDFASAYKIFSELEERVAYRDYTFYKMLSQIYSCWDNLSFNEAIEGFEKLFKILKSWKPIDKDIIGYKYEEILYKQHELIKPLKEIDLKDKNKEWEYVTNKHVYIPLLFSIYTNALRRSYEGKYDVAILLLYRILELIAQVRLASYGFSVSLPDYSKLPVGGNELLEKMNENIKPFRKRSKNFKNYSELPQSSISLFDAYVLLKAIEDKLVEDIELGLIYRKVKLRNKSIFAHGFGILMEKDFNDFHETVKKILIRFCEIERIEFEKVCKDYKFVLLE
ncbi:TIGR02710 family CRISPR-associated CARF protein [Thermoanaerobacter pentosaceus]|uniref:CRISPR-associated protein (TIGR02710 family) n=1 Tax=Thermoanaerobacter pentosaceus TaxID=694059 RepID=A0ABT9M1S8_9THEO|nr:TIGR02710 family CRISPR-associated CARF protein [Thermoanaerobacter pentosaceus]MDP9750063.1 CRISPR-associated protein (TIGR02710 family) [Thermoanaerobacter pentosaceus]